MNMKQTFLVAAMLVFNSAASFADDSFTRMKELATPYTVAKLDCQGRARQLLTMISQEETRISSLGGKVIEKEIRDCTSLQDNPSYGIDGKIYTATAKIKYSVPADQILNDVK
jgi:hypothetical protein